MQTIILEKSPKKSRILDSDQILDLFKSTKISSDWSFEGTTPSQTSKLTHLLIIVLNLSLRLNVHP